MEPSAVRGDAVLDNQPAAGARPQRLVYLLIFAFGLALVSLGAYARFLESQSWLPELCIAAGVAIAAPGVLSYLYRKYMLEDIKLELQRPAQEFKETAVGLIGQGMSEIATAYRAEIDLLRASQHAGLYGVYISRAEAIQAFVPFLDEEKHEIVIIGSSLRGLLQEYEIEYENARAALRRKKDEGVRFRVLLTHPVVADLRARQEDRNFKDIGKEIVASLETLITHWKVPPDNIRLYVGTPTCFGIKTARAMLLNTYPYMKEAFASPCLVVKKPGYMYEHFLSSHFRAWSSAMALAVPTPPATALSSLDGYAEQIRRLVESV